MNNKLNEEDKEFQKINENKTFQNNNSNFSKSNEDKKVSNIPTIKNENNTLKQFDNEQKITEKEAQKKFYDLVKNSDTQEKTITEKGRDILNISSMANLMTNEDFIKDFQEVQRKQIINDLKQQGKIDAIKNAAKKQENRNLRNTAFYNAFKPFFENFMGIKEPFGLIPMIVTVLIFYVPYIIISLVLTVIKYAFVGINEIFSAIALFKKPAKALCLTILWIAFTISICLALLYGAQALFDFKII